MFSTALTVTGVTGAVRYVSTFWLYRGFSAPSMPSSVAGRGPGGPGRVRVVPASLQKISVASPALGGHRDTVYVVLPPGYASNPGQSYPVLYLLHGFPGSPSNFLTVGGVEDIEATLVAEGLMKPIILVMPTGAFSFLADEEWADGVRKGNSWETFVARDLVSAIDARYRTMTGASGRGIAGLSEGGYGALNIGLHHPGEFGLLESWSGYMMADNIPAIFDHDRGLLRYNSPAKWVVSVAPQLRADRTYIWFYCGTSDELAVQNRAFSTELAALGVTHYFFERPGTHNWRLWRELMPRALITASEQLGHG
ncbi:MAG TPA: alpha/beta hydrolase-fold protein [Streptosporangiaceae bacterium]|nr:alpha/beta hydrolase-fold protein [Streptosporangiaceae bacterium]